MGRKNKLQKFAENLEAANVYQNIDHANPQLVGPGGLPCDLRGQWAQGHFGNNHPLTLELACGRGEYANGLARRFPGRNFVGVDVKGARIWRGAQDALAEGLSNVAYLRTRIEQLDLFFGPSEVSEIWITFPDPFSANSKANRRLTAPGFLDRYRKILLPGGLVHLKTDDEGLYQFTLDVVANYPHARLLARHAHIYAEELPLPELAIQTYYERQHLADGKTIKYLRFEIS